MMDPDLLAKYPWIEEAAIEGASVTEMEFIHGVFDAPQVEGEYAFFYHRQSDISKSDDPERLSALIARIRATERPYREFENIEELGRAVHDDLLVMIDRYWPESDAPSPLELERRSHAAFSASRTRAYIPNPEYLKAFSGWVSDGTQPLVISGSSGFGKSSLVAYLVEYYRKKHPTAFVIEHYVGATQSSGTAVAVMRHVVEEIRERFGFEEELPSKPEELEKSFSNWLYRAEHHATQAGIPLLIVVDAINQLDESGQRLAWLPKTIPAGVKLLISTTPGEAGNRLEERGWAGLEVRPLEDERVRQSIVVRYLGEFHKGIAPEQLRQVVSDAKASSPLYLRVVAEELRLHGEHETVAAMIARYGQAENLLQVFDLVLERLEGDYGEAEVRTVLELIWVSRSGLSETELLELTGMSRLELSRLLFALDYHLSQHDGLLGFFHDYLRRAVEKRFLNDDEKKGQVHERLVVHFDHEPVTLRATRELLFGLKSLGEGERLKQVLAEIGRFELLWESDRYEVLGYWSGSDHQAMVEAYRAGLEEWLRQESPDAAQQAQVLGFFASMYDAVANWHEAERVQQERLLLLRELNDRAGEAGALTSLAWLARNLGRMEEAQRLSQDGEEITRELGDLGSIADAVGNRGLVHADLGEYDEALVCYREQEKIAREIGDRRGIAMAIGNRGGVHYSRGEYDATLVCYREWEEITRELGDRRSIARAVGNRGGVHYCLGEYDEALVCYREQAEIAQELGDRRSIAVAVGNRGMVVLKRGEYAEALRCYREQEEISRELGDQRSIANAVGNRGLMHGNLGEFDEALACCREWEVISRELGDRRSTAFAIGSRGLVEVDRGEYSEALECFQEAAEEHIAIGFRYGLSYWLAGTVRVLLELVESGGEMPEYLEKYVPGITGKTWHATSLRHARECAVECLAISRETSKQDTLFDSQIFLARIDAAQGERDFALKRLSMMLDEVNEEEQRAELHYRFWKISLSRPLFAGEEGVAYRSGVRSHRTEALRLFRELLTRLPKHVYRKRIDELTAMTPTENSNAPE
jgi:tetratricopeptide (TPR) repeat protein